MKRLILIGTLVIISSVFLITCKGGGGGGGGGGGVSGGGDGLSPTRLNTYHEDIGGSHTWYTLEARYDDSNHEATAVSLSGPGLAGEIPMTFEGDRNRWIDDWPRPELPDPLPPVGTEYTITVNKPSGIKTYTVKISGYVQPFAQCIQPSDGATVSSPVTFSWTAVSFPGFSNYYWDPEDEEGEKVNTTSITKNLSPGQYGWLIHVRDLNDNTSMNSCGHFTVQ